MYYYRQPYVDLQHVYRADVRYDDMYQVVMAHLLGQADRLPIAAFRAQIPTLSLIADLNYATNAPEVWEGGA